MANSLEYEHCFAQLACDLGMCSPKSILYGLSQKNSPDSPYFQGDLDQILQETGMLDAAQCREIKLEAIGLLGEVPHIEGYELRDLLSVRGFGRLYRAHQISVDREVFIKVLNAHGQPDSPAVKRFKAEAQILGRLNHHNICGAIDMGETSDCMYLVFQHPDGTLASDFIQKKKFLSRGRLINLLSSLAHLLRHIHKQSTIHGNISPENIIIHEDGTCSLTGFDYAICNSVEQTSLPVWPVEFPAAQGLNRLQADFYAAAASVWLLAGGTLFADAATGGLATRGFGATCRTFAGLRQILRKMLCPQSEFNYGKASEIIRDLQDIEGGIPPEMAFADSHSLLTFKATEKRGWVKPLACAAGLLMGSATCWFGAAALLTKPQEPAEEEKPVFILEDAVASLPRWQEPPLVTEEDSSIAAGTLWKKIVTTPPGKRSSLLTEFILKYPKAPQYRLARQLQAIEREQQ